MSNELSVKLGYSVGDLVRYKDKPTGREHHNKTKAGWVGTVMAINSESDVRVHFPDRYLTKYENWHSVFGCNVELCEIKYDPTQQGDTDEDL